MGLSKTERAVIDAFLANPDEVFVKTFRREDLEEIYFEIYHRYPSASLTKPGIVGKLRQFVDSMERARAFGAGIFARQA